MVMPVVHDAVTTIEELLALPDEGLRHELLEGVHVVTPAPRPDHELAFMELAGLLRAALFTRQDVALFGSRSDLTLGPRTLVQPDLFVVRKEPGKRFTHWSDLGVPVLAVEILSPTTAPYDRLTKRLIYQKAGVGEYWVVDLDSRLVERWTPVDERPEIIHGVVRWTLPGGATGEIDLPAFFGRVLDS